MGYDARCEELARVFLDSEPPEVQTEENIARLAQVIQTAIEDELEDLRPKS